MVETKDGESKPCVEYSYRCACWAWPSSPWACLICCLGSSPRRTARASMLENRALPALSDGAAGAAAVLGVILIVLGRGLLQRRSLALPLTVVVLGLSAATRVPQGPDIMVVLSVLVAILLIRAREWARANDATELSLAAFRKLMEGGPDLTRTERIFAWFIRHLSFNAG